MGLFSRAKEMFERYRPLRQRSDTAGKSDRELDARNVSRVWEHLLGSFQAVLWFLKDLVPTTGLRNGSFRAFPGWKESVFKSNPADETFCSSKA